MADSLILTDEQVKLLGRQIGGHLAEEVCKADNLKLVARTIGTKLADELTVPERLREVGRTTGLSLGNSFVNPTTANPVKTLGHAVGDRLAAVLVAQVEGQLSGNGSTAERVIHALGAAFAETVLAILPLDVVERLGSAVAKAIRPN